MAEEGRVIQRESSISDDANIMSARRLSRLTTILNKDVENMEEAEAHFLLDWYGSADGQKKALDAKLSPVKKRLMEYMRKNKKESLSAVLFKCTSKKRGGFKLGVTGTGLVQFLKKIGKVDLFDSLFKVNLTDLQKYVDIHTLEKEKILVQMKEKEKSDVFSIKPL